MGEQTPKISIDLNKPWEESAISVLKASFPDKLLSKPRFSLDLAMVVSDLYEEMWVPIQRIMLVSGMDDVRLTIVRDAVVLASWNQVLFDFGGEIVVVAKEPNGG